jgi:hypothetical protein
VLIYNLQNSINKQQLNSKIMKKTIAIWIAFLLPLINYAQQLSISPDNGTAGKKLNVTITGQNTHFKQGSGTSIQFSGGTVNSFQIVNDKKINASITIPANAYTGNYTISVLNTINGPLTVLFHVKGTPPPRLIAANPTAGNAGQTLTVTITGNNTHFKKNKTEVHFDFTQATATTTVVNDSVLKAKITIPANTYTGDYHINVTTPADGIMGLDYFHVNGIAPPNPHLSAIYPATGNRGRTLNVTITGVDTHFDSLNGTKVWFHYSPGSSTISVNWATPISPTSLNASISIPDDAALGAYTVEVKNNTDGSMLLQDSFHVQPAIPPVPSIISINSTNAKPGQLANFTIRTANTHYKTSKPSVIFEFNKSMFIYPDTVIIYDDTLLYATVPIPSTATVGPQGLTISNPADGLLYSIYEVTSNYPTHFTSTYDSISNMFTLALDSITSTASGYYWNFGDGTYSSAPNPTHTFPANGYYNVCLTAIYGTVDSSTYCHVIGIDSAGHVVTRLQGFGSQTTLFKSSGTTGIMEIDAQLSFVVYPNPAKEFIKVTINNFMTSENNTIRIYGVDGRLLKQQLLQKDLTEVDVSELAKGVYIVQLTENTKTGIIKFIKE